MIIITTIIIMIKFIEGLFCKATNLLAYLVVVWARPYHDGDYSFIWQRTSVRPASEKPCPSPCALPT